MKARVKATEEIVEVEKTILRGVECYINTTGEKIGSIYMEYELDFNISGKFAENCLNGIKQDIVYTPDYWTRLEHQYAGMAMQTMLATLYNPKYHKELMACYTEVDAEEVARLSKYYAHALVEKLKEKEK